MSPEKPSGACVSVGVQSQISVGPAGQDFAAGRDLRAHKPKFLADIYTPLAHLVRLSAKLLSGRKDLPKQSFATTPVCRFSGV